VDWYQTPDGHQRVWYEPSDIERIMSEQLRAAKIRISTMSPVPDLEQLIEGHLRVELDQYAALPDDVLGLTEFDGGKSPRMFINANITSAADDNPPQPGARGRWRATLAHEASHVILHRYLFDPDMAPIRRGDWRDPDSQNQPVVAGSLKRVECLHRDVNVEDSVIRRATPNWREVQANRGMASLLMPETWFVRVATLNGAVKGSVHDQNSAKGTALIAAIAHAFDVSKQAAALRLKTFEMLA
jgi:Zn-dependent peptidase ImmA (M78 family)